MNFHLQNIFGARSKSGLSLVSVLVALGISGIIAVAMRNILSNSFSAQSSITLRSDLEGLRRTLVVRTDCDRSFKPGITCPSGTPVTLFTKSGAVLAKSSGQPSRMGKFALKAECNSDGDGLIVRAGLLRKNKNIDASATADFLPDPLTSVVSTWSSPNTLLYPEGVILCPSGSSSNSAGTWSSGYALDTQYTAATTGLVVATCYDADRRLYGETPDGTTRIWGSHWSIGLTMPVRAGDTWRMKRGAKFTGPEAGCLWACGTCTIGFFSLM